MKRSLIGMALLVVSAQGVARADVVGAFVGGLPEPGWALSWPVDTSLPGALGSLYSEPDSDSFLNVPPLRETNPTGYLLLHPRNHLLDERIVLGLGFAGDLLQIDLRGFGSGGSGTEASSPPPLPPIYLTPPEWQEEPIIPEPASLLLVPTALAAAFARRRRPARA